MERESTCERGNMVTEKRMHDQQTLEHAKFKKEKKNDVRKKRIRKE